MSIAYKLARRTVPEYSTKFSRKTYTQRQHVAIICLKVREEKTYRKTMEMLVEMLRVRKAANLEEIPNPLKFNPIRI
ncbi:hypothetical protein AKJ39_04400 [candidate division MSBL1 archaeon SCGC-AAA259J03]|uniref:Transposase n=1 Tax=candidate division MSBL1 archaeon SCGC-AAA259J03 TaxID=1698269 RepID=A0A656YUY4_9EURY|nr:hypothetical protein AKJ39_04400 [candidate division MSBL1 archaeon SCGC-AAA259J03]